MNFSTNFPARDLRTRLGARLMLARVAAAAALVGTAGVALAVAASVGPQPPQPYALPLEISEVHVRLAPLANTSGLISQSDALTRATTYADALARGATGSVVQPVLFSDDDYGTIQADGSVKPFFQSVPAYVIRFVGAPQPVFGGPRADGTVPVGANELNVVVDASTGAYMEMFSYR